MILFHSTKLILFTPPKLILFSLYQTDTFSLHQTDTLSLHQIDTFSTPPNCCWLWSENNIDATTLFNCFTAYTDSSCDALYFNVLYFFGGAYIAKTTPTLYCEIWCDAVQWKPREAACMCTYTSSHFLIVGEKSSWQDSFLCDCLLWRFLGSEPVPFCDQRSEKWILIGKEISENLRYFFIREKMLCWSSAYLYELDTNRFHSNSNRVLKTASRISRDFIKWINRPPIPFLICSSQPSWIGFWLAAPILVRLDPKRIRCRPKLNRFQRICCRRCSPLWGSIIRPVSALGAVCTTWKTAGCTCIIEMVLETLV